MRSTESPKVHFEKITCFFCETENGGHRNFCDECGKSLWQDCHRCAFQVPVSERFCPSCGLDLKGSYQALMKNAEEAFQRADALQFEMRLDDAILEMSMVVRQKKMILSDVIEKAKLRLDELRQLRKVVQEKVIATVAEAKETFEQRKFGSALALLEEIHPNLRSEEIKSFLEKARIQVDQIAELRGRIKQAVMEKKYTGELLTDLDSLLDLDPSDEKSLGMLKQLSKHFFDLAKKFYEQKEWEKSWKLLESTPERCRPKEFIELRRDLSDIRWFLNALNRSPLCDPTIIELSKKFAPLVVGDKKIDEMISLLQNKRPMVTGAGATSWQIWRESKGNEGLKLPVAMFTYGGRIENIKLLASQNDPYFSRFGVALGLALQGIGLAKVDLNAMPKNDGLLSKLSFGSKSAKSAIGIEFGQSVLKAVRLELNKNNQPKLTHVFMREFLNPLARLAHVTHHSEEFTKAMHELKDALPVKQDAVFVALPAVQTLIRQFRVPKTTAKEQGRMIEYEARHKMPIAIDELSWDSCLLGSPCTETEQTLTLLAAKKSDTELWKKLAKTFELKLTGLQDKSIALYNLWQFDAAMDGDSAEALLDLGAESSQLIVANAKWFCLRPLVAGSDVLSKELASAFRLTFEKALALKHRPSLSKHIAMVYEALEKPLFNLHRDVELALDRVANEFPAMRATKLNLTGGGSLVHGVMRSLRDGPQSVTEA
jgi:Tfp pilus assembly PilM family ATPase